MAKPKIESVDLTFNVLGESGNRLHVYLRKGQLDFVTGCFNGNEDELLAAVLTKHKNNAHARAYREAIAMSKNAAVALGLRSSSSRPKKRA